ncbi:WhiB family transcriptional regulator [Streptomyces sp. NPDC050844]|uniref:WhiB family transcriptional regulator n=1 Tax=Streptomyces sp. NPDC050844 TaxID=3155790 RepID=UPI0033CA6B2F
MKFAHPAPDTAAPAPRWQDKAECHRPAYEKDRDLWFSDGKRGDVEYAVSICNTACPVRNACRQDALNRGEEFGIWGGLTERERRSIRRKAARDRTEQRQQAPAPEPAKTGRKPAECGTRSAYQRHVRKGEPIDDACRAANTQADHRLRTTGTTKACA